MNTKRKGNRNEHRSIAILKAEGYACCRSAASLGVFDIIGIGSSDIVMVQAKSNRWPSPAELSRIRAFPAPENCRRIVHRWVDRQTEPDTMEVE